MFEPINTAHAISEVVVYLQFSKDLKAELPSLMNLKATLKDRYPAQIDTFSMAVEVNDTQGQLSASQPGVSGFRLSRHGPDGRPDWLIQIGGPSISIHCLEYSRWNSVWSEMRDVLKRIFDELGSGRDYISSIGLKYVDRFIWQDEPGNYDIAALLSNESPYLHDKALDAGERWHCNSGWFEDYSSECEILNQLNIDSGIGMVESGNSIIVTIDHAQTLRAKGSSSLSRFAEDINAEDARMHLLVEELHQRNKATLGSLLRDAMARRISLEQGSL